jgi:hypothetical protein
MNNKKLTLDELIEEFKLLTLQEKIKVLDKTDTLQLTYNYKWREEIQREILNLPPKNNNSIHGPDGKESLKSKQLSSEIKDNTYPIIFSQPFGVFGRINAYKNEENSNDCKDTYATVFYGGIPIVTIFIKKDENMVRMFEDHKILKEQELIKNPNARDGINITFELIKKYNLDYKIVQMVDNCIFKFDL